jgi:hypothetical protein
MPLYITKKKTDYFSQTKKGGKANWIIERMFFLFSLRVYFCHQPRTLDLKSTVHGGNSTGSTSHERGRCKDSLFYLLNR